MDATLAVVTMLPIPIIAWLIHRVRTQLSEGFQQSSRAFDDMTSVLADTIPGVRVVKAFAQENREIERYRAGQRPHPGGQRSPECRVVVLLDGDCAADAGRVDRDLGLRRAGGSRRTRSRSAR